MIVLVTGGLGYIGSHTCVALLEAGYQVVILDSLASGKKTVLNAIETVTGSKPELVVGDVRDKNVLRQLFSDFDVKAVMHFAGLKSPFESLAMPLSYYDCNVGGTITLLSVMLDNNIDTLVFSSSATVYGLPKEMPVTELCPAVSPTNPYGRSKLMAEHVLQDVSTSMPDCRIACLRYFNPVSAHSSGLLGEDPATIPGNLMPYICQVASGKLSKLTVFGGDYPTSDGTGVRDYIHVQDLAEGHVATLQYLFDNLGLSVFNLGTGRGVSVLDLITRFEKVTGTRIPFEIGARRDGDVAECWADVSEAECLLGWKTRLGLTEMCRDAWQWQQNCQLSRA